MPGRIAPRALSIVVGVVATLVQVPATSAACQQSLPRPSVAITPARPEPGAIVRVSVDAPVVAGDSVIAVRGTMAGEPLHFRRGSLGEGGRVWSAVGGVPVDAADSLIARVLVERRNRAVDTVRGRVLLPRLVPPAARPLTVDSQFTKPLDASTEARIARENERAREIGRRAHTTPPMWSTPFQRPRSSAITSEFGSGRVFNGRVTSRHLGVDFRGNVGDTIRAANRGVVALVDTFYLAGKVVYIDHGGGIVTGYFHLSRPLVTAGDTVSAGDRIGLVGATGRVTGPHLHWSARYGTITVNPLSLVGLDPGVFGK
jgi:murein DD-endopeptidase MepM/ murein hydrolase activator NlpD